MDAEKMAMQRRIDTLDQHANRLHAALTEAERENARLKAELEIAKIQNQYISEVADAYEKDIEKLERERDVAIRDLSDYVPCNKCKHWNRCKNNSEAYKACAVTAFKVWEWRGLCEENGGVDE